MKSSKQTILCVDDNEEHLELIPLILEKEGFETETCNSLENCLPVIRLNHFSAIILEYRFGSRTSVEVCHEIRSINPDIPIIFYSTESRETEMRKAIKSGADAYVVKPDFDDLLETVKKLILKNTI